VTLVELTVTIALLSTVIAIVTGGMITATHMLGTNTLRLDEIGENRVAIEAMTKTLRTAVEPRLLGADSSEAAFIQGDATQVQFYAALSSLMAPSGSGSNRYGPVKMTYTVTGGVLVETYQLPDLHAANDHDYTYCTAATTGCEIRSRALASNLAVGTVFTYYGETQTALAVPLKDKGNLEAVDSIDIVLTSQTGQDESSTVATRVSLVNAGTAPQTDEED